jgi:capsid portal protein
MFDLVQPVYNMEYLSKIYEVSTYNYAAINAKTANVVGLGYDFLETRKTNDMLDSITDDKQLKEQEKSSEELRQDLQEWLDSTNDEDTFTETSY